MPDLVDTGPLHHAVEQLEHAVAGIAAQAGDLPAVLRLRNDVERIKIDMADCTQLHPVAAAARQLEIIPDTPYDESLWQGVDDEGLGGFHAAAAKPQTRHHRNQR